MDTNDLNSSKDFNNAEKEMAARAMGRYHALLIKNGIKRSASYLKELGNFLPSYLDGIADEIDGNTSDLESVIENLFNEEKIEKSLEKIGSALEGLFGTSNE